MIGKIIMKHKIEGLEKKLDFQQKQINKILDIITKKEN
ncbi:hypothetical protein [Microvirus mar32]|uniref:Uncharacterized protein n=1 Tax=Microvirus mar32 TaxID=2851166 RepID=A0A8F5MKN0_9VIRU|nr:hypothetical protein [Microvirus mar32]